MDDPILKVLIPATLAFLFGILLTPLLTHYLFKYQVWKKVGGKTAMGGHEATEFNRLKAQGETKTPRMGGIVIWGSVFMTVFTTTILAHIFPLSLFQGIDFLSRSQTLVPAATLLLGAMVGLLNDIFDVIHSGKGLALRIRLLIVGAFSLLIGGWFYYKLGISAIGIPFDGAVDIGIFFIPFFMALAVFLYASGVIDGIDGLAGGVFATIYTAYAGVAVIQTQYDIAAFCATMAGGILAFLWFNIPPARFWMTETGSMPLTLTLSVIVVFTDNLGDGHGITLLPVIGLLLFVTVASNAVQIFYRMATKKKFFRIAPLHHHFEAIGWPSHKVTMRYWVISIICAIVGIIIAGIA